MPPAGDLRHEAEIASGRAGEGIVDWRVDISSATSREGRRPDLVLEIRDVTRERRERRELADLLDQVREVNGRLLDASLREAELAERAAAASDAKSTFLATMSHELRTPLTAIIGYEELLVDGLFGPISDTQKRHLARIGVSAKHLLALIDQILTLARVEAGEEVILLEESRSRTSWTGRRRSSSRWLAPRGWRSRSRGRRGQPASGRTRPRCARSW